MADTLYLSLWFSDFDTNEMLPHALRVIQEFSFSKAVPGITSVVVHPISWEQPTILEQRFRPGIAPEEAMTVAADLLHDDYAYVFEANWDLWTPLDSEWILRPMPVRLIARGEEFEENEAEAEGQVQIDFGLDTPFLHEELELTGELKARVQANVQGLVDLINRVQKNAGAATRLLWSESDESLAQRLISRLQKVQ